MKCWAFAPTFVGMLTTPKKSGPAATLYVCTNFRSGVHSSCAARGSKSLLAELKAEALTRDLDVIIDTVVCLGHCEIGPNVRIAGGEILHGVTSKDIGAIIDRLHSVNAQ